MLIFYTQYVLKVQNAANKKKKIKKNIIALIIANLRPLLAGDNCRKKFCSRIYCGITSM
jgi:hypothetical protein